MGAIQEALVVIEKVLQLEPASATANFYLTRLRQEAEQDAKVGDSLPRDKEKHVSRQAGSPTSRRPNVFRLLKMKHDCRISTKPSPLKLFLPQGAFVTLRAGQKLAYQSNRLMKIHRLPLLPLLTSIKSRSGAIGFQSHL